MLKTSSGILIICNNKALVVHSTNASWWKSYTPPKGGVEEGETFKQAASREVKEEVGIEINSDLLDEHVIVTYRTKANKIYKLVYLYIYKIDKYLIMIGV